MIEENPELERCLCGAEAEADIGGCTDICGVSYQDVTVGCMRCWRSVAIWVNGDEPFEREAARALVAWQWNAFILAVKHTQTKTV